MSFIEFFFSFHFKSHSFYNYRRDRNKITIFVLGSFHLKFSIQSNFSPSTEVSGPQGSHCLLQDRGERAVQGDMLLVAVMWRAWHPCWSSLHGGCLVHHFYPSAILVYKEHCRFLMAPAVNVWGRVKNKISILSFDKYFETINTIVTPKNIYTLYAYFACLC